jgi:hypothetical protein
MIWPDQVIEAFEAIGQSRGWARRVFLTMIGVQNRRKYLRLQWSTAVTMWVDPNQLLRTDEAAAYLAVSPETLCAWRRRGIGPPYFRFRGASVRDQNYVHHDWPTKKFGTIGYPLGELIAFIERYTVQAGRLPRPFAGRLPGGQKPVRGSIRTGQRRGEIR